MAGRTRRQRYEAQVARQRALEALNLMRQGRSLSRAAKRAGTTAENVVKQVGAALRRRRDGSYVPTPADHLKRSLRFLTPDGIIALEVRSSRTASQIARHWAAVSRYLLTGRTSGLRPFDDQSVRVAGRALPFVTDPRTIDRLAQAGEVRFEEIYAIVV